MKNTYVKPEMQVEEFLANQYVATCGMVDGNYVFTCDAPKGTVYYYDNNGQARELGGYKPCSERHVTSGTSEYFDGFIDYNNNKEEDPGENVLVWREKASFWGYEYYVDYHASASLTREQIAEPKS